VDRQAAAVQHRVGGVGVFTHRAERTNTRVTIHYQRYYERISPFHE
jgi:hypothetical protein